MTVTVTVLRLGLPPRCDARARAAPPPVRHRDLRRGAARRDQAVGHDLHRARVRHELGGSLLLPRPRHRRQLRRGDLPGDDDDDDGDDVDDDDDDDVPGCEVL